MKPAAEKPDKQYHPDNHCAREFVACVFLIACTQAALTPGGLLYPGNILRAGKSLAGEMAYDLFSLA
jgi:hypothetical protein